MAREAARTPREKFMVAGLVAVVVILAVALVVALWPRNEQEPEATAPAVTPSQTATVSAAQCGAGASDDESVLNAAPTDTTWQTLDNGWLAPVSEAAGPQQDSNGLRTCFQHSAEGALQAASWTWIQLNNAQTMRETLAQMVADSPGKRQLEGMNESLSEGVQEIVGYNFLNYSPENATIRLLVQTGTDSRQMSLTLPMVWENGEWKLRIPDSADLDMRDNPDASEFLTWKA